MPLDIQSGSLADRIRRALGLRGRMPLKLDETVVPTVETASLTLPPYRGADAMDFSTNVFLAAAGAGRYSFGGVGLSVDQPGAIVIDGIWVTSLATDAYSIVIGTDVDYDAADSAPLQTTKQVENYGDLSRAVAGATPLNCPIRTRWGSSLTLRLGAASLHSFRVSAADDKLIPWRYTLRPGWFLAVWRSTANLELDVNFHGTYYPDAPNQ
jgi:hypothetical protein